MTVISILETIGVSFAVYLFALIVLRLSGKRTLLKMNAFEFIITVSLGTAFGNILINQEDKLWHGKLIFILLLLFQYLTSTLSSRSDFFSRIVKAHPTLLFYDGKYYDHHLKKGCQSLKCCRPSESRA